MTPQPMTAYRVVFNTETRPNQAAASLDHLPPLTVDAPDVDTAARVAVAHHIDNRPDPPPPPGTSFALIVIAPNLPKRPHHNVASEPELYRLDIAYWPTSTKS